MHLGLFVHYMHPGKAYQWGATTWADGSPVKSLDELADNLDVHDLADMAASMKAQYVIFTTWHANMNALYPSNIIPQWIFGHTSKRDVIRDLIEALEQRDIKLILYIHPSDGHDFTKEDQERGGWNDGPPFKRWNDFINEVISEVTDRYGSDIAGYYIDGGLPPRLDVPRLGTYLRSAKTDAWLIQNSGLNPSIADYGALERMKHPFPASDWLRCQTITNEWWAMSASVSICPELAYQYTVLQAAVSNRKGGGVAWAFGPHPGGRWETGVRTFSKRLGELVSHAGNSLFNTSPSTTIITKDKTALVGLLYVATQSRKGDLTYLHVLKPPKETSIRIPPPADGRKFSSARLYGGEVLDFRQDETGITITVNSTDVWDDVDTIIEMR